MLLAQLHRDCIRETFLEISSHLNQRKLAIEFFKRELGHFSSLQWEETIILESPSEPQSCLEPYQRAELEDFQ